MILIPLNKVKRYEKYLGLRFGNIIINRITMAEPCKSNNGFFPLADCKCDCGKECIIRLSSLKSGHAKSCGCLIIKRCKNVRPAVKHDMKSSIEYKTYCWAKQRCENPNNIGYKDYGGRGIEFRFKSFEEFYNELGKKLNPSLSLDRKDNDGHYEIGNVRWATKSQQSLNQRKRKY